MNKKQYFTLQIIFLVIMFILIGLDSGGLNPYLYPAGELTAGEVHMAVNDSLREMGILISFFLSNTFMILGFMEKKQ